MTHLVSWRQATLADAELLRQFTCCLHMPVSMGRRRDLCEGRWAHDVQTHIRVDALSVQAGFRHLDHRLMLLFDGSSLVGVAAHEQLAQQPESRWLECLAVSTAVRGKKLSNAQRASTCLFEHVIHDMKGRVPPAGQMKAKVHPGNMRSLGLLDRMDCNVSTDAGTGFFPVSLRL